MFDAHVLKVLIASPGDTVDERDAVERALHGWNGSRAEREQIMLAPWRWEKHAVPELGGSAQSIINTQAVDDCDIVIAIFDGRLGTATADAVSGTAEEINRASASRKPVHVWFSDEPLPRTITSDELARLETFKETMRAAGLLGSYANLDDLQHQVRNAIERDLTTLDLGRVVVRTESAAQARKVVTSAKSISALGRGIWGVTVINNSASPITELEVQVTAHDDEGAVAIVPAKEKLSMADVFGKLFSEAIGGGFGPMLGRETAQVAGQHMASTAQSQLQGTLQAHLADGFDDVLGAEKDSTVTYSTEVGARVEVTIEFDDENGIRWTRTNGNQPVRLS